MIVPNGKRRSQVNQGGLKHESIWDSSFFTGVAGDLVKEALAPVSPPGEAGAGTGTDEAESPESQAMSEGNSMRMNPAKIPPAGQMKGNQAGMPGTPEGDMGGGTDVNPQGIDLSKATPDQLQQIKQILGDDTDSLKAIEIVREFALKLEQQLKTPISVVPKGDLSQPGNWQVTISPQRISKGAR